MPRLLGLSVVFAVGSAGCTIDPPSKAPTSDECFAYKPICLGGYELVCQGSDQNGCRICSCQARNTPTGVFER